MFMLCVSSCFSATEEEQQAQSKKALKKQQKEAEKAAKKAEKQAKLVSVVVSFSALLFHIRRPLIQLVRLWREGLLGIVGPRGYVIQWGWGGGQEYPLFKYSCDFGCVYVHPNKMLFSSTLGAQLFYIVKVTLDACFYFPESDCEGTK